MNNEQSEQHEDETTEAHETKEEAAKADTAQQPIEHATADEVSAPLDLRPPMIAAAATHTDHRLDVLPATVSRHF